MLQGLWAQQCACKYHRRHTCQPHAVLSNTRPFSHVHGQIPSLSVLTVSALDAGACGTSSTPGIDSENILASHMQSCLTLNHSLMFMGRYHLCLCLLCLRLMQELVAPQARLELTLKTYLPATCSLVHTRPRSRVHGADTISVCVTCVCAQCRSLSRLKHA